jgi:hypothetical protein
VIDEHHWVIFSLAWIRKKKQNHREIDKEGSPKSNRAALNFYI